MATAEEGGATANASTSSYGGGGAGGKFRKKPFRRQTTPYDRPPTALRGNSNTSSWLTKLVVEPASKLISFGADRFFASVFRKRLPAPPPPQPPEVNNVVSDGSQGAILNLQNQYGAQEPAGGECSQPINSSISNRITELEQLLKQKTFTRYEIDHLTKLLKSRAVEVTLGDDSKKNEESASDSGRHQQFASGPLEENRNEGIRSSAVMSTPIFKSKVLEDDIASPAELAKAYMGNKPSKISPSLLGMRSQVGREDIGLLSDIRFASKSPSMSSTRNTSVNLGAPENGFITPRSRGRSAIYNMARTPYSRAQLTSNLKFHGTGANSNGYGGPSMSSSSLSRAELDEKFESKPMALKRRSSVLDTEVGSVGPIRRIRQKSNLLAPRMHHTGHGVGIGSEPQQKLQLIGEQRHNVSKSVGENENENVPSTSYAHVPSKSSEVAAKILQHLEKLTPKEKSESKLVAVREKSSRLSGHTLRSMGDMDSSTLLLNVQDDYKLGDRSYANLPGARDSSSQKQGKVEENNPKESVVPSDMWNPVTNNASAVSFRASGPSTRTVDSVIRNGASQPYQKKRAFRMSAQEDSLEQDEDIHFNGLASRPFSEERGRMEVPPMDRKLPPAEQPKLIKTTIQPEVNSASGLISGITSELNSPGAVIVRDGSSAIPFQASEEATATSQSAVLPVSAAAFDKPKEANNPPALFSFSSKVADKSPSLPAESSSKRPESELESYSSLVNVSASTGSQVKIPELERGGHLNPLKMGDIDGKSDTVPSTAANGLLASMPPAVLFTAASSSDTNQISAGGSLLFTSSTSIANFVPSGTGTSTSATSSSSILGLAATPSSLAGPVFKFGAPVDPSSEVSAASTSNISEVADLKTKTEIDPSSGTSSCSHSTIASFTAASSASSTFGLGSSNNYSTANNLPSSFFSSASKSLVSGAGTASQGTSFQSVSSALLPSFNMNSSTSFGSSLSNSPAFNPNNIFGFSSSASSSDTSTVVPGSGPTSSVVKFGTSSTTVSDGSAVISSSGATPGIFSFGFSSSSSSTNAVGSSSGSTTPIFGFGGSSLASASVANTASSFSSGTSGIFNFGGSSSASSSTINSVTSNSAPSNVFGSSWQSPKSSIFGSTLSSSSPSTGFSFGASSAPTNAAPMAFNSSTGAPPSPVFSFTTASASVLSQPSVSISQPVFGNPHMAGFAASPGNNDQMNAEDSMAEDIVQSSVPSVPVFGQPSVAPSPPGFTFGSTVPPQVNPFMFGGQQNQVAAQNTSPFQASGSLEFNAGGSFSLGSGGGGGDKSGRKIVKINRNKNRKK